MIVSIRQIPTINFAELSPIFQGAIYNGRTIVADPVVVDGVIVDEIYKPFGRSVFQKYAPKDEKPNPIVGITEINGPYQHFHYFEDRGMVLRPIWSVSQYTGPVPFKNQSWQTSVIHVPNTKRGITFAHMSILNFIRTIEQGDRFDDEAYFAAAVRLSKLLAEIPTINLASQRWSYYLVDQTVNCFPYDEIKGTPGGEWKPWIPMRPSQSVIQKSFEEACGIPQLVHMYKYSDVFTKMRPDEDLPWESILRFGTKAIRSGAYTKNAVQSGWPLNNAFIGSSSPIDLFKDTRSLGDGGTAVTHNLKDFIAKVADFSGGKDHFMAKFVWGPVTGSFKLTDFSYIEDTPWGEFKVDKRPRKSSLGHENYAADIERCLTDYAKETWSIPLKYISMVTLIKNSMDLIVSVMTTDGARFVYGIPMAVAFKTIPTFTFEHDLTEKKSDDTEEKEKKTRK